MDPNFLRSNKPPYNNNNYNHHHNNNNHNNHKTTFSKFATFPNDYIHPSFSASYHRKYHGLLQCDIESETPSIIVENMNVYVVQNDIRRKVHESFISHYWSLIQMAKPHNNNQEFTEEKQVEFPIQIFVNYALDNKSIAHVITYEIWIDPTSFGVYMQTYGTFPFEVSFTQLLRRMLSKCDGVQCFPSISKISDMEYKMLLEICPKIPHWKSDTPLFRHQLESFYWMYKLEQNILEKSAVITISPQTVPILNTGYVYNRECDLLIHNQVEATTAIPIRGGILADVTGSGKTAVALALILATLNCAPHDQLMKPVEDQIYFRSQATLIITPSNLSPQWLEEIHKFVEADQLKIVILTNMREFKKINLQKLLEADIVLTTDSFLNSKRYLDEVSYQTKLLIKFPFMENDMDTVYTLAWRIAVNKKKPGFEQDYFIPLESIRWKRIIMDEIHMYMKKSLLHLTGCFCWGLTGTPMIQRGDILSNYVNFISQAPTFWVPSYLQFLLEKCFHRFEGLELDPIEKHLHLIEHSTREKQLLKCCQEDLTPEKMIQLCSYFHLVDVDDMDQKIQLMTIEDIIKKVQKDKRYKIRDLESKIKYHDLAIQSVGDKIEESKEEMKKLHKHTQPPPESFPIETKTLSTIDTSNLVLLNDLHHHARDMIKGRQKRHERMVLRQAQLVQEKNSLEKSMGYFEAKVSDVKTQPLENCPICLSYAANVITQCGHLFCRACIIKCLKRKYQCPLCKHPVSPTDAHEIKLDHGGGQVYDKEKKEKVLRYGTKLTKLLELVKHIIQLNEKVVIYVQWSPLMNSIREMFREQKIPVGMIFGNSLCQNAAIKKFKATQDNSFNVLLSSVDNVGLDLVDANHLIFAHALVGEEYVVKAMEDQAISRIQRTGQTKKVHVYWLITRGTIEEQTYLQSRV